MEMGELVKKGALPVLIIRDFIYECISPNKSIARLRLHLRNMIIFRSMQS